jgi:hypothetical protein
MSLRDDELESLLRATRDDHFAAGFAARVVRRTSTPRPTLGMSLQRYFVWMVPAAVTAIALLAIHNARSTGAHGLDGLLALQPVTLDAAYTMDAGTSAP